MLRFSSPCEENIMTNVNIFLKLIIEYLQIEISHVT